MTLSTHPPSIAVPLGALGLEGDIVVGCPDDWGLTAGIEYTGARHRRPAVPLLRSTSAHRRLTLFPIELNLLQTYSGKPLLRSYCIPGTAVGILCILSHLIFLSFETITLYLPPFYR